MSVLYLAASLPLLELGQSPPLSREVFRFSCSGLLSDEVLHDLDGLLRGDRAPYLTSFGQSWGALEIQIFNECARKRGLDRTNELPMHSGYSVQVNRLVMEAFHQETPLDREWILDKGRFHLLEDLIGMNSLGLERILAFAGQLRLVHRWSVFDEQTGRERFQTLVRQKMEEALGGNLENFGF